MTKQNNSWGPKELTKKLLDLTNKWKIRWSLSNWGFRAWIQIQSCSSGFNDVVIDLEHKEGNSGSEIPCVHTTADSYALFIRDVVSNNLLFWNSEINLIKPLWTAAEEQAQPKTIKYSLGGKTYGEINRRWPKSRMCAALQKRLEGL